jgi:hypothetical protein
MLSDNILSSAANIVATDNILSTDMTLLDNMLQVNNKLADNMMLSDNMLTHTRHLGSNLSLFLCKIPGRVRAAVIVLNVFTILIVHQNIYHSYVHVNVSG